MLIEPLETCSIENQLKVEQSWIDLFKPRLNISKVAGRPGNPNKVKASKAGKIGGAKNKASGQWNSIAKIGQIAGGIATGKIMGQLAKEGKSQQYKDFQAKAWASCSKDFIVIEPNGERHLITNLRGFCKNKELTYSCLLKVAEQKPYCHQHKGWRAYKCCHLVIQ